MQQSGTFDATWEQLKPVLVRILSNEGAGIDNARWMQCYTFVNNAHMH